MDGRHTFTLGLWIASVGCLALLLVRGGPWLWPRLFPGLDDTPSPPAAADNSIEPEVIAEELHRELSRWGSEDGPEVDAIYLPRGKSPTDLQDRMRTIPRLAGVDIYVTQVDDLLHRFRAFDGSRLLLERDVRPWLPDRPVVSPVDPPEMAFVSRFVEADDEQLDRVCGWSAPLAVALPPFAAHTVKAARRASRSSKGVVLLVDPGDDLKEQLAAVPDASGVLLEQELPPGFDVGPWLDPLGRAGLFLLDGRGEDGEESLGTAAAERGVAYVKMATTLNEAGGESLARNLTVRRGYGFVVADGNRDSTSVLRSFIEAVREEGYPMAFPAEVARMHGSPRAQAAKVDGLR